MITRKSLGIFWTDPKTQSQDEVDGLFFFALWNNHASNIDEKEIRGKWLCGTVHSFDAVYTYDYCSVSTFSAKIDKWPDETNWQTILKNIMEYLIELGAEAVWCGDETCSPCPNALLDNEGSGNIYGFFSQKCGLIIGSKLNEEFRYAKIPGIELSRLKTLIA